MSFTVRNAALEAAGVVRLAGEAGEGAAFGRIADFVVHARSHRARRRHAAADLHRLHRLQRHHRLRQQSVQTLVPVRVRAQSRRDVVRHALRTRRRRCRAPRSPSLPPPSSAARPPASAQLSTTSSRPHSPAISSHVTSRSTDTAPTAITWLRTSMPSSRRSSFAIAPAATRAAVSRADARSSTYRASGKLYFSAPAKIRVSRPRRRHRFMFRRIAFAYRQRFLPVLPVLVLQQDRDRRPNRLPVPHAGDDVRRVASRSSSARRGRSPAGAATIRGRETPAQLRPRPAFPTAPPPALLRATLRQ